MLMDKVILGRMNNQSKDTKVGKHGAHTGKGGEATLCTWTWCVCARARVCVCARACSVMPNSLQPQDYSLPGSSLHGIFQARILEQVAISFSRGSSRPRDRTHVSCISCIGRQILYYLSHRGQVHSQQQS